VLLQPAFICAGTWLYIGDPPRTTRSQLYLSEPGTAARLMLSEARVKIRGETCVVTSAFVRGGIRLGAVWRIEVQRVDHTGHSRVVAHGIPLTLQTLHTRV
jgi:hypothetical protein